jgi:glycosyltransferase domain-containing protein
VLNNKTLSKLTIIISTVPERERYLLRLLSYLSNSKFKVLVIGAKAKLKKLKFSNNIKFILYNKKKRAIHKWIALEKYINTKYILNLADDDFVLFSYLENAVNFLEKKKAFHCVESFALRFDEQNKKLNFNEYFIDHHKHILKSNGDNLDLFHGNLIRNVFKKKDYYKILRLMITNMNTHPQWDDFFFHFLARISKTKIYYSPEIGHLRSENERTINIKKYRERSVKKIDILKDKKNFDFLSLYYSRKCKISKTESLKKISNLIYSINKVPFKRKKIDIWLSIVTERLFIFKINSFYILRNMIFFPIWDFSKINEIKKILKIVKQS